MTSVCGGRNFETITWQHTIYDLQNLNLTAHDLRSTIYRISTFREMVRFASSCVEEKKKFLNFQPTDSAPVLHWTEEITFNLRG